jgi:magnesium transporter
MESDDAADILGEMSQTQAQQVLLEMPQEEADEIIELLKYPEDCAGGLMQTELVRVPLKSTVLEAVYEIQRQHEAKEGETEIHAVYVVDDGGELRGQLSLERLILSKAEELVADLIEGQELFWVDVNDDQEEVADYFRRYDLISAPVLDSEHRLLGRITVDDIMDVIAEEASEDIFQMAGAGGEDVVYDRVIRSASLRLPWLFTNLFGGLITGYLTWMFTRNLSEILVLVTFVPVITGMGGNVGTQSSSITVRGFAVGRIALSNIGKFFLKEMRVGALMGLVCGIALTVVGIVWLQKPYIGLVVGLALFMAMTLAASMGSLFPALFQRIGVDPALASGPFVTTFNDVMGILIYYTTAMMFRSLLIPAA